MDEIGNARPLLGIEVAAVSPGTATARLTVGDELLNVHGTCHGGVIFTLADTAFEHACNSHGPLTVAASASIEFVAPVAAGSTLTAVASETHRDGRAGVYDVVVTDGNGRAVAHFRGRSRTIET